jgi:hypothetical protein
MLRQRVPDRIGPVLGLEDDDVVLVSSQAIARADLADLDRKLVALDAEVDRGAEHAGGAAGAVQRHRRRPVLKSHGPEEPGDAEQVVGVVVAEEDFGEGEADGVPHHLPLVALPAVEEDGLPFALDGQPGDVAIDGRRSGAGAEEGGCEHARAAARTASPSPGSCRGAS